MTKKNTPPINFFSEDIRFEIKSKRKIREWIIQVIDNEEYRIDNINYIFCGDQYLHAINKTYLSHDTLTDIVTFDMSEKKGWINGDVFISIERVKENSQGLGIPFRHELSRVMVHGLLHLCGYRDKTREQRQEMTEKEDFYLSLQP